MSVNTEMKGDNRIPISENAVKTRSGILAANTPDPISSHFFRDPISSDPISSNHLLRGNERVTSRQSGVSEDVVLTIITRIEVLQGRFASVLKAADEEQLLVAQQRLAETERSLAGFTILPVDAAAAAEFARLLGTKGLRQIGRGDLLIASIAVANRATLVTRNLKDFRKVPGLMVENWADRCPPTAPPALKGRV